MIEEGGVILHQKIVSLNAHRSELVKSGRTLEYFTIIWNMLEALVAVGAGLIAGSAALVGFGFDSVIESTSGAALLWRLREGEKGEKRERAALKLVGVSFLLLALYVAFDAGKSLLLREPPEKSFARIAIAALSLLVMPLLAKKNGRWQHS